VVLSDSRQVYALCAIDALGIPFMLNQDAVIRSEEPITRQPIRVHIQDAAVRWEPETAVALTVSMDQVEGVKAQSRCPVMNFFAGTATAEVYRQTHCAVATLLLSQEEAAERGKRAFADLLAPHAVA
jgi:hypothetical protein